MKLLILLISYALVITFELLDLEYWNYYLSFTLTCFLVVIMCAASCKIKFSWIVISYALIQLVMMVCYWQLIDPVNFEPYSYVIYDSMLPFKDIMLLCEMIMLIAGVKDVRDAYIGFCDDMHLICFNNTSDRK